jgi:2-amino-4-hydroxy-6-hydroxymethyldihydropteridine diphosphokinase
MRFCWLSTRRRGRTTGWRAPGRAFVLRPWIDLQPYGQLPGHGWLTDLLNAPALAADLAGMTPRPDLSLESTREQ